MKAIPLLRVLVFAACVLKLLQIPTLTAQS